MARTSDRQQMIALFRQLAQHGHAPEHGCELFGIGYDEAFSQLLGVYVDEGFAGGESGEKFVIGPYGSGKTHFLRHFMTLARERGCATADVQLNKTIDYTKSLIVYREVARRIQPPDMRGHGIAQLLEASLDHVRSKVPEGANAGQFLQAWIDGIGDQDFELPEFGKVLRRSLEAAFSGEKPIFETTAQWLAGAIDNKMLIKALPKELFIAPISKNEHEAFANGMMLSLFQFVRRAGFTGTVVGYDEAEQGFDVGNKKRSIILSMLQSDINAISRLDGGAALLIFALTPDVAERFDEFAALQQRVDDPGPGMGFFDGNTLAPKIDLTYRQDPRQELVQIGRNLVTLFFRALPGECAINEQESFGRAEADAADIVESEPESSNRRTMVKRTCAYLMTQRRPGRTPEAQENNTEEEEA